MFSKLQQVLKGKGESSARQSSDKGIQPQELEDESGKQGEASTGAASSSILANPERIVLHPDEGLGGVLSQLEFEEKQAEAALCQAVCTASSTELKIEDLTCIGNTGEDGKLRIYTDRRNPDGTDKIFPSGALSLFLVTCKVSSNYLKGHECIRNAYPIPGDSSTVQCMAYCLVQENEITKFTHGCRNTRQHFIPFLHSSLVHCAILHSALDVLPFSVEEQKLRGCLTHCKLEYIYSKTAMKELQAEQNAQEDISYKTRTHLAYKRRHSLTAGIFDLDRNMNKALCAIIQNMNGPQVNIKKRTCIGHTCGEELIIYNSSILHAKNKVLPQGMSMFLVKATVPTKDIRHAMHSTAVFKEGSDTQKMMLYCLVNGSDITNFLCECKNGNKRSHKPFYYCQIIFSHHLRDPSMLLPEHMEEQMLREALAGFNVMNVRYSDTMPLEGDQKQELPSCSLMEASTQASHSRQMT
ncbi:MULTISPECIES: DUF3023 domain-containing protein [Ehrlichia]|uniref:Uncharacterized protein n=1 Tax=Ehrlichia cf. muris str. EmCRT TaxID=1359167 RepID=A0A0F3NEA0_9RICK|nr:MULTISPECIES: DUF3023 domain-containing protein [Ehrlichia]KJV66042.1 hypothetical protein EMUCRT_0232 [Ehrlichia cf. muris str. EmCRT]OUC04873.1 hypothetical protein DB91_00870 [Ehrlichia sp. Wisconsin_h]